MKKTIRLNESDLTKIVKRIISEQDMMDEYEPRIKKTTQFTTNRRNDIESILSKVHSMLGMGHVQGIDSREDMVEHAVKMRRALDRRIVEMQKLDTELGSALLGLGLHAND